MKKALSVFLALAILVLCLASCGVNKNNESKLKIVVTIFPIYDWVKNILGDEIENTELTMLLDSGADLHNYQATVEDIFKISDCDLFIYVGGESDEWAEKALQNGKNPNRVVINLMEELGDIIKEEEIVEGMEGEEGEEEEGEEPEYDEHIWLSLNNAVESVKIITEKLCSLNKEKQSAYKDNANTYSAKLSALDTEFKENIKDKTINTVLFADRFPFRYMFDDYGIKYYAAFVGCSAETEASFETIVFLSNKVDELNLKYIAVIDSSDSRIAQTVKNNTQNKNQTIVKLDSLQSTTKYDVENGKTYYDTMKQNLEILSQILH